MEMTMNRPAHTTNRLSAIRRLYVYVVAFVSLVVGLTGAAALLDTLSRLWLDTFGAGLAGTPGFARAVASSAGLLLVATPIFLVHWSLAQRHRAEPDERDSVLRKLFLYAATALSVSLLLVNVYWLVEGLMGLALGAPARESSILPAGWLAWTATAAINGALVLYWYRMLRADGDYGVERRGARIVRQIFLALAGLVGVDFVMGYKHWFELDFTAGIGFMGIAVALLGKNHPFGLIFAAFLFGSFSYGGVVLTSSRIPKELFDILQAFVIILIVCNTYLAKRLVISIQKRRLRKTLA